MTRTVTILGATGSIGRSTREVILSQNGRFRVEAVVGGRDAPALAETARALGARFAALADPDAQDRLRDELSGSGIASGAGAEAVAEAVDREADIVVAAISGAAGLGPTVPGLEAGPLDRARQQGDAGLRRRRPSWPRRDGSAPRSSPWIPSTTPSPRRWRPADARTSSS